MDENKTKSEIQEALDAVRSIRQSIKSNIALVRPLFMDKNYVPLCSVASLCMALLAVWEIIKKSFFTQNGVAEGWTKYISIGYLVLLVFLATTWKALLVKKYAKENINYSMRDFLRLPEIFNLMLDSVFLLGTIAVVCFVLSYKLNSFGVFLPASFLYVAVISLLAGDMYSIVEYRLSGMITLAFTIIISIFMKGNYMLWLASSYCVYFALLALVVKFSNKER